MKGDDSIYRNLTDNWEFAAPISFQYERGTEHSRNVSRELRTFYFKDEPITVKNGENLGLVRLFFLLTITSHKQMNVLLIIHYNFCCRYMQMRL